MGAQQFDPTLQDMMRLVLLACIISAALAATPTDSSDQLLDILESYGAKGQYGGVSSQQQEDKIEDDIDTQGSTEEAVEAVLTEAATCHSRSCCGYDCGGSWGACSTNCDCAYSWRTRCARSDGPRSTCCPYVGYAGPTRSPTRLPTWTHLAGEALCSTTYGCTTRLHSGSESPEQCRALCAANSECNYYVQTSPDRSQHNQPCTLFDHCNTNFEGWGRASDARAAGSCYRLWSQQGGGSIWRKGGYAGPTRSPTRPPTLAPTATPIGNCGAEIAGFARIGTARNNRRCQEGYSDNGCGGRRDCRIPGGHGNFPSAANVAERCAANSQCQGFNWIDQGAYLHNADLFYQCTPTTFSGNHIKWSIFVKC